MGKYTDEYRRECADYAIASGKPITEIAKELGLNSKTLNSWVVRRRRQQEDPVGFAAAAAEDAELKELRKRNRGLAIRGCTPYKSKRTTIPDKDAKPKPDLIKRDFTSPVPTYKLVGDITYLRTGQGWLYLSTVIDLNTRMVVGWYSTVGCRIPAELMEEFFERTAPRDNALPQAA